MLSLAVSDGSLTSPADEVTITTGRVMPVTHVIRHRGDPGLAVVDIFRVRDNLLVEHWDVLMEVPAKPVNPLPMF